MVCLDRTEATAVVGPRATNPLGDSPRSNTHALLNGPDEATYICLGAIVADVATST